MNNLTELIKREIKKNYGSIRKFSNEIEIPATTITTILSKTDINNASFSTIYKICKKLNINISNAPFVINDYNSDFLNKLSLLDDIGRHTVEVVLEAEFARCTNTNTLPYKAAFGNAAIDNKASKPLEISVKKFLD